jgi:hypothetical protein
VIPFQTPEALEDAPTTNSPNNIENFEDFTNYINTNYLQISFSHKFSVESDYKFLQEEANLSDDEVKQTLRWTAHNLELGGAFGFPTVATYFTSPSGMEYAAADLNSFHPIKAANLGNYLQHVLLQLHTAYTSADSMDRDSSNYFTKAVKAKLKEDPTFDKKLRSGYITPKQGRITVAGTTDINRIRPGRFDPKLKLEPISANWNLVGGYQKAEIPPEYFKNPQRRFSYLMNKIRDVIYYANQNDSEGYLNVDPRTLFIAAQKIDQAMNYGD